MGAVEVCAYGHSGFGRERAPVDLGFGSENKGFFGLTGY
jgi:hypothetical protein